MSAPFNAVQVRYSAAGNGKVAVIDTIDAFAEYYSGYTGRDRWDYSWMGGLTRSQAILAARNGHQPSVASSDEYMGKFEELAFQARKWTTVDAVAGGAPNVGAYLAGSPVSMRRRQRVMNDFAPLTIFLDVVSSGGISAEYLKKRGAAVLALVRMLGATRPVQLYAVGGLGGRRNGYIMVKMPEVADLGRSAFMMAHPAAARGMLYACAHRVEEGVKGSWAFHSVEAYRHNGLKIYAEAIGAPEADCLYVPPPYLGEQDLVPEKWLPEMLAKYGAAATDND